MKIYFSLLIYLLSVFNLAFAQNQALDAYVGQSTKIRIPISNINNNTSKCNIEVTLPNQQKVSVEVEGPQYTAEVEYLPNQQGQFTVNWEGKNKFRGLYSILACPGSGIIQLRVNGERDAATANKASSPAASVSAPTPAKQVNTEMIALRYFGRINEKENMRNVFSNVFSEGQKEEIAWSFIFVNNVLMKIQKSNNFQEHAIAYSQILPTMRSGVERYLKTFQEIARKLGVSQELVLQSFGIKLNQFGFAEFEVDKGYDIEGQMNMYIWHHSGIKGDREYTSGLRPYYRDRNPMRLYTTQISSNTDEVEKVYSKVFENAKRIDDQLAVAENDRIRREKEAQVQREAALKRQQEEQLLRQQEERRRQDFLNSPAGQKQIAAEKEAERQRQIQFAKEFPYYAEITCNNGGYGNFQIHACFSNSRSVLFELRNGSEYNFYTLPDIMQMAANSGNNDETIINLRNNFQIRMQNSGEQWILGLRVIKRATGEVLYQKKVSGYGVISLKN